MGETGSEAIQGMASGWSPGSQYRSVHVLLQTLEDSMKDSKPVALKQKFIKSILYFSSSQAIGRIVHSLAFVVILKILSPTEIGLVSIAAVFITILSAISEVGLGVALVQAPKITERQKSGVFWTGVMLATISYAAVFSVAPVIARYYKEPYLESLIRVYMLVLIVNALKLVPYSLLVRDLKFGKISMIESASMVISSILMVVLALRGFGSWSLVLGELGRVICLLIGTQISMLCIPGVKFSFRDISPLLRFGSFATGSRILYNFYTNIDYLIVGKFFGISTVGIYTLAYRLVFDPLKAWTGMINQVAYPTFSKLQTAILRLRRYFFSTARMNLSVLGLFLVIVALFSDWVIISLGYEKWVSAVPMIRMFCIIGFLRCIFPLIPQLLNALGHSNLNLRYSALCAVSMPFAFYIGAQISIYGVVMAWIIVYPLMAALLIYYALKFLELSLGRFVSEFISSIKILLVFIPASFLVRMLFTRIISGISLDLSIFHYQLSPELLSVIIAVLISLILGIFCIIVFDKKAADAFLNTLRRKK
jgi:teichuronic acid exporter